MNLFTITLSLLIAALSYYLYAIYSSYQRALKIGLPIVICPINPLNVAWLVASVPFRPILSRVLPRFLWQRLEIITYGFEFHTRGKPFFETFGKAYTLVAPGTIEVYVGDAELVSLVLSSRKGYEQAEMAAFVMGRFGPNVSSSHGDSWLRRRKIIAPAINERISNTVWTEARSQVQQMLSSLSSKGAKSQSFVSTSAPTTPMSTSQGSITTNLAIESLRDIAINVLGAAGYGQPRSFDTVDTPAPGMSYTFMSALFKVVNNLEASSLIPPWLLSLRIMPKRVRALGKACSKFPLHQQTLIEGERSNKEDGSKSNLPSTLVRLSNVERMAGDGKGGAYLTEDELRGNLYQFTLAGMLDSAPGVTLQMNRPRDAYTILVRNTRHGYAHSLSGFVRVREVKGRDGRHTHRRLTPNSTV